MTTAYKILAESLHATADAALAWFVTHWGIQKGAVLVEAEIHPDIGFRPTFSAKMRDGHLLCVEVSENIYKNALDSFILDCQKRNLPVKLIVAVPREAADADFQKNLRQAKRAGAGLLEVDHSSGTLVEKPLALSLAGVRSIDLKSFPAKYREALQGAEQTFRDGDPAKGAAALYDELEACFRRYAAKCEAKGAWTRPARMKIASVAWATLIQSLQNGLDRSTPLGNAVSPALLARILGVTTYRNETGHKPKNLRERVKRDLALRTRFESAGDILKEFVDATKRFGI